MSVINNKRLPHLNSLTPILRTHLPLRITPIYSLGQQPPGMKNIKYRNRSNHHRPIKRYKVPLIRNQIPTPPLRQLNRAIDAPRVDTQHGEDHCREQRHQTPRHGAQQPVPQTPTDEVRRARDEDRYREHLEDDAGDHDVSAGVGVAVGFVRLGGGHAAADCLDDERDDVTGAEDPEVEAWGEDRRLAAEEVDELSEEDVDSGCEEGGGYFVVFFVSR